MRAFLDATLLLLLIIWYLGSVSSADAADLGGWLSADACGAADKRMVNGQTSEVLKFTLIPAFSLKGRRGAFPLHFRERVRVRVKAASRIHAA